MLLDLSILMPADLVKVSIHMEKLRQVPLARLEAERLLIFASLSVFTVLALRGNGLDV